MKCNSRVLRRPRICVDLSFVCVLFYTCHQRHRSVSKSHRSPHINTSPLRLFAKPYGTSHTYPSYETVGKHDRCSGSMYNRKHKLFEPNTQISTPTRRTRSHQYMYLPFGLVGRKHPRDVRRIVGHLSQTLMLENIYMRKTQLSGVGGLLVCPRCLAWRNKNWTPWRHVYSEHNSNT